MHYDVVSAIKKNKIMNDSHSVFRAFKTALLWAKKNQRKCEKVSGYLQISFHNGSKVKILWSEIKQSLIPTHMKIICKYMYLSSWKMTDFLI